LPAVWRKLTGMIKPIPLKLPAAQLLRESISNIERGGYRPSVHEDQLLDGIAEGMTIILAERLSPLERRLSKLEATLIAMGVPRDD